MCATARSLTLEVVGTQRIGKVTFAPLFRKNTLRDSWFLECYGQKRWHSFSWSRIRANFRGLSKMPEVCQLNKSSERVRVRHSNRTLWTNTQRHPETVQLQNPKTCGWRVGVALRLQWHRENNSTIGLNLDLWQPMVVVVVVIFVSALLALWYSLKIGGADASEAFEVGGWGGGTETLFLERVCPFACGSTLKRIWRRVALSFEERKLWFWCLFWWIWKHDCSVSLPFAGLVDMSGPFGSEQSSKYKRGKRQVSSSVPCFSGFLACFTFRLSQWNRKYVEIQP